MAATAFRPPSAQAVPGGPGMPTPQAAHAAAAAIPAQAPPAQVRPAQAPPQQKPVAVPAVAKSSAPTQQMASMSLSAGAIVRVSLC
nr:NADH-quinone oxidoreductase subunit I 2-like [Lytechinus pictus]